MKSKILQIALRIALIQEEFSETEISEAVNLLQEAGVTSNLFTYLSSNNSKFQRKSFSSKAKSESPKTQIPIDLKNNEPEKYQLLVEFESSLKNKELLTESVEIRRLCESLDKNFFSSKKSRLDLIHQLIQLLISRTVEEIAKIINEVKEKEKEDPYYRLSKFLIDGDSSHKPEVEE
ncbi:MAG: hypothetical protein EAZ76_11750 [Nostocales cyanobacterium]|nr:MAG: hypothetical protein EAZ87_11005 [Nostocales cyanobacterium]TAF13449.1 MAG: hypothetical protein EAZ76_11750 [Nostocales cyanobacterium]